MSETKLKVGPFDRALMFLPWIDSCIPAIRVLQDWPKWEPLIRAAGSVDKGRAIRALATLLKSYVESGDGIPELERDLRNGAVKEIRALLESLPESEERK